MPLEKIMYQMRQMGLIKKPDHLMKVEKYYKLICQQILDRHSRGTPYEMKQAFMHLRAAVLKIVGDDVIGKAHASLRHSSSSQRGSGKQKQSKAAKKKPTAAQRKAAAGGKKRKAPAAKGAAAKGRKKGATGKGKKAAADKKKLTAKEKKAAAAAAKAKAAAAGKAKAAAAGKAKAAAVGKGRKSTGEQKKAGGKGKKKAQDANGDDPKRPKKPGKPPNYPLKFNNHYNLFAAEHKKWTEVQLKAYGKKVGASTPFDKLTKTKMIVEIWKYVNDKTKDLYKQKHQKHQEKYDKDVKAYIKKHKKEYEQWQRELKQHEEDLKIWQQNKKGAGGEGGGGSGGAGAGGATGVGGSKPKPKQTKAAKPNVPKAPPGNFLPTKILERTTSDDEDILRAFVDGDDPDCISIDDMEREETKLLNETSPSEETRNHYFELANDTLRLPKHWHNLSIIKVHALSKLMEGACRKSRAEISLPMSTTADESPYSRMSFAVDHIVRDVLEDLMSLRNHRLACRTTMDRLSSEKPDDGPLRGLDDAEGNATVPSRDSAPSHVKKTPVQLRVVKVPRTKDTPQVFFDQCEKSAEVSIAHARAIEQNVLSASSDGSSPGSLYELAASMLREARDGVDEDGDAEMSSSKLYRDEEFQIPRGAFQSRKTTGEGAANAGTNEADAKPIDGAEGEGEGKDWEEVGQSEKEGKEEEEEEAGEEEEEEAEDNGITVEDLKFLLARDRRYFSLSPATSHALFLGSQTQ
jgi:hypothetical protein